MKIFTDTKLSKGVLCSALVILILLWGASVQAMDNNSDPLKNSMGTFVNIGPYSYGVYTITEGMRDFPIQKELSDTIPLSMDLSIIFAIGWTGDKLTIKLTDGGGFGDRLVGIAIARYAGQELVPYWSTVYSDPTHASCEMIIPAYPPSITVYLISGYWGKSVGENPYAYTISLSFPQ